MTDAKKRRLISISEDTYLSERVVRGCNWNYSKAVVESEAECLTPQLSMGAERLFFSPKWIQGITNARSVRHVNPSEFSFLFAFSHKPTGRVKTSTFCVFPLQWICLRLWKPQVVSKTTLRFARCRLWRGGALCFPDACPGALVRSATSLKESLLVCVSSF